MVDPLNNAGLFLVNTVFDIFLLILMARILLAYVHADYFSPLTQFIVKTTKPLINPIKRFLPTIAKIETSTLVIILIVEMFKFSIICLLALGTIKSWPGILILAIGDMIKLLLNIFFYAILLQAILSWVQPGYSPVARTLSQLTDPIMRPIKRIMPPVGGLDLTAIPGMIILKLLIIVIASPILLYGNTLSFG